MLTSYVALDYDIGVGYFNYFISTCVFSIWYFLIDALLQLKKETGKAVCVLLFDIFSGCSCSIKEINRLIWKGMSNIYYWEKLTFSKLWFSWKENLRKCTTFEEQKSKRYVLGNVYISIVVLSYLSSTKLYLRFQLNCFLQQINGFYQSSFRNEVHFRYIMNVSLNILANN